MTNDEIDAAVKRTLHRATDDAGVTSALEREAAALRSVVASSDKIIAAHKATIEVQVNRLEIQAGTIAALKSIIEANSHTIGILKAIGKPTEGVTV